MKKKRGKEEEITSLKNMENVIVQGVALSLDTREIEVREDI